MSSCFQNTTKVYFCTLAAFWIAVWAGLMKAGCAKARLVRLRTARPRHKRGAVR